MLHVTGTFSSFILVEKTTEHFFSFVQIWVLVVMMKMTYPTIHSTWKICNSIISLLFLSTRKNFDAFNKEVEDGQMDISEVDPSTDLFGKENCH